MPPSTPLPSGQFARLPLRLKVLITPAVGIVLFVAYVGFTLWASSANTQRLERVRDVTFPTLTLANANVALVEKIAETLNSAVAAGEGEMVDSADALGVRLRDNLRRFGTLDAEQAAASAAALARFDAYYGKARSVTLAIMSHQLDMGSAGPRFAEMRNELTDLNAQLAALRDGTHARFVAMMEASAATAKQTLLWGMAGAGAALLAGLMAWLMAGLVARSVGSVLDSMRDMASGNGDLTRRIRPETADEVGQLVACFNDFVATLQADIGSLVAALHALEAPIGTMTDVVARTEESVVEERSVIADVSGGVGRILESIDRVADNAGRASSATADADEFARIGTSTIQTTVQTINDLARSVQLAFGELGRLRNDADQIGSVVNTIKGIADQTNLLALNAAIEAARAGEQGRGFAVVADEVRTLSGQTQEATIKVTEIVAAIEATMSGLAVIVETSQAKAVSSVEQIAESGRSVEEIAGKVALIRTMNGEIAAATEQQKNSAESIKGRMGDLADVSNQAANQSGALAGASNRIRDLAGKLQEIAGHFRI